MLIIPAHNLNFIHHDTCAFFVESAEGHDYNVKNHHKFLYYQKMMTMKFTGAVQDAARENDSLAYIVAEGKGRNSYGNKYKF